MGTLGVAVGVLQRPDGRVLVAHRDPWRHQGGALELPGGKIEAAEAPQDALARELSEELGIDIGGAEPLIRLRHRYPDRTVVLEVFLVRAWVGEPYGAEGQAIEWLEPSQLTPQRFPAANRPIVAALRLPAHYLITPAPADGSARERQHIVDGVRRALGQGVRMIQLRAHGLASAPWHALVEAVASATDAAPDCRLLVNAPVEAAADLPLRVGLHLNAAGTRMQRERPVEPHRPFGCSCHDPQELASAEACGADLAVLGPVHPTPSHPDAPGIGWAAFANLAATTNLPVYALGGVGPADLPQARAAGAIGIAGIRGLWPAQ